jgi:hypothetical protein
VLVFWRQHVALVLELYTIRNSSIRKVQSRGRILYNVIITGKISYSQICDWPRPPCINRSTTHTGYLIEPQKDNRNRSKKIVALVNQPIVLPHHWTLVDRPILLTYDLELIHRPILLTHDLVLAHGSILLTHDFDTGPCPNARFDTSPWTNCPNGRLFAYTKTCSVIANYLVCSLLV